MHAISTGPVAIYTRCASAHQQDQSIEHQLRRCREFIAQQGGKPDDVQVFADLAASGADPEHSRKAIES